MFRPMLSVQAEFERLRFPVLASPKLDGIRALKMNGILVSRSLKPIPNRDIQKKFAHLADGFDGELITGPATAKNVYRRTNSCVMSYSGGDVEFTGYYAFDWWATPKDPFEARYITLLQNGTGGPGVNILAQRELESVQEVEAYESEMLFEGYEGIMLRAPRSPYKHGRSTSNEGFLLKVKRFTDAEAMVVGFEELVANLNESKIDERGYTARSSHQAGQVPQGTLGALVCYRDGQTFKIGTGFTAAERQAIWDAREEYEKKMVKFKHLEYGAKTAPRHPVFLGWRSNDDISPD